MNREAISTKLIDLNHIVKSTIRRNIVRMIQGPLEKVMSLSRINHIYDMIQAQKQTGDNADDFFQLCMNLLNIRYTVSDVDLAKIPSKGPVMIVANHPFGGAEAIVMAKLLLNIRPDIKFLGNYLLTRIDEIKDYVIPVEPFGRQESIRLNTAALKRSIQWLKSGGVLVTFPAGEVSHIHLSRMRVVDKKWNPFAGAVIRHAKPRVVPIYVRGRNSVAFNIAGLIHPRLRTAMLPHELVNKRNKAIDLNIGTPICWKKLSSFHENTELIDYLRFKTYFLRHRYNRTMFFRMKSDAPGKKLINKCPVMPPVSIFWLRRDISKLSPENLLLEQSDHAVYVARSDQIPNVLNEIGRLRELAFRDVHEGTGRYVDLDQFDTHYLHLFLWNRSRNEVVGAYRLGLVDRILEKQGPRGLYTHTLFRFRPGFLEQMKSSLEIGRSFIRSEYQKKYGSLLMMWQGIGRFVALHPQYRILFGPVSISDDYQSVSRNLMVQFLKHHRTDARLSDGVSPRSPYYCRRFGPSGMLSVISHEDDMEEISLLVSEIERDGKGIPVLLKHYLKLNARIIAFNIDKKFSNVVDGLIKVDLMQTDSRMLDRFMGVEGRKMFYRYQRCGYTTGYDDVRLLEASGTQP